MVEGHSVHRVAKRLAGKLIGKAYIATSPNGRFKDGARLVNRKVLRDVQAVGKNLFAFFGNDEAETVVVHVHFGMAGAWAVYDRECNELPAPEPTKTNRLRLVNDEEGIVADLSAMTVTAGTMDLYLTKRKHLGHDPLRDDSDPERLWQKVRASRKSIGALIMDQSYFAGPGNIYRAEILFKAGVHPDVPGNEITKVQFDTIWRHTVSLLRRGYETGSILTVDPDEAAALGRPELRRYIYNTKTCPRCSSNVKVWTIANRTCYCCPSCQPRSTAASKAAAKTEKQKDCKPFVSHCAPESLSDRLNNGGPEQLTMAELRAELSLRGVAILNRSAKKNKSALAELLRENLFLSPEAAAASKAAAGESLAVEHVAELAPQQARRARRATTTTVTRTKRPPAAVAAVVTPTKGGGLGKKRKRAKRAL